MKDCLMFHFFTYSKRRGFILYVVCALAIGLFILIAGLNKFKSGAVLQLSKTVTQERMIVVAQSAINETLAAVKADINDVGTSVGSTVKQFWFSKKEAPAQIWAANYAGNTLRASKTVADESFGNKGSVSCEARLYADEKIVEGTVTSYTGHLVLVGKVSCDGVKDAVKITEVHDIRITDLSFPLLDKYAFFVKSYCSNFNTNEKRFIIEGVKGKDKQSYSFVYLGNRNYPSCTDYPEGGSKHPPVIVDLDFEKDKSLLGGFYHENAEFNIKDADLRAKTKGQFFYTSQLDFKKIQDKYDKKKQFFNTRELEITYLSLVESARKNFNQAVAMYGDKAYNSNTYQIINDFNNAGGQAKNSEVFWSIIEDLMPVWKYYYGYTDYNHIYPEDETSLGATHPFTGLVSYFNEYKKKNVSKVKGGSMPEFYGEDRKRPVYIDGPVYVRFFKVGMMDQVVINLTLQYGGLSFEVPIPSVACVWEKPEDGTYSSQYIGDIDGVTGMLMSHPVDWLSINNFYFGDAENVDNKDSVILTNEGWKKGYKISHYIDEQLRTVSNFYINSKDFIKDRIKNINGEDVLDLDGISVIYGEDKAKLDLSSIKKYRGKGMIVSYMGNCVVGDLIPSNESLDYLKIMLMGGRFVVDETKNSSTLYGSFISTAKNGNRASCSPNQEGGFFTKHIPTTIVGNLIIDSLFDMRDKKYLKIIHDPKIYQCEYPVRVSVGAPKAEYVLDYKGKD